MAVLLAYAILVVVTPLLHHDLECHWRTPGHCVACIATPAAVGAADLTTHASPALTDAGGVEHRTPQTPDSPLPADNHGRSPPL